MKTIVCYLGEQMKSLARLVVILCFLIGSASVAGAGSDPSFNDWLSLRDDQGTSFQLLADALDGVTEMSWAPSGHLIAYATSEGNDGLLSRKDVVVASPSGEQHVVWARTGESPIARWSPDSRHLAIFPRRHTLSIWRTDGGTRDITSRLIENATFGGDSYWTANSRYIVGAASNETTSISSAIVVDVDSGKVTRRTLPLSRGGFQLRGVLGDRLLITCGIPRCSGRALYTLPPVGAAQLRKVASIRGMCLQAVASRRLGVRLRSLAPCSREQSSCSRRRSGCATLVH